MVQGTYKQIDIAEDGNCSILRIIKAKKTPLPAELGGGYHYEPAEDGVDTSWRIGVARDDIDNIDINAPELSAKDRQDILDYWGSLPPIA